MTSTPRSSPSRSRSSPSSHARHATGVEPPPTRIHRPEALVDRPFTPPKVNPVPEIPEPGLVQRRALRGAVRRRAVAAPRRDQDARSPRSSRTPRRSIRCSARSVGSRAARGSMGGCSPPRTPRSTPPRSGSRCSRKEHARGRRAARPRRTPSSSTSSASATRSSPRPSASSTRRRRELAHLEAQRRGLRDKRKELERRQKAYLKSPRTASARPGSVQMGDSAPGAAAERRAACARRRPRSSPSGRRSIGGSPALERPIGEATAKLDAAKAELDAAKRSLSDAREGHNHRLAELDAEQKRKSREIAQAEGEIARRLVTLGTLVNLNRIEDPQFGELYQRIDRLRGAITARTTEIEKLTAEREAYDRGTLVRGLSRDRRRVRCADRADRDPARLPVAVRVVSSPGSCRRSWSRTTASCCGTSRRLRSSASDCSCWSRTTGDEARALFEREEPALVVLDAEAPDGFDVAHAIKAAEPGDARDPRRGQAAVRRSDARRSRRAAATSC